MTQIETPTFGSLFAGIGGFDLGFERAGMQCRWQVEIDEFNQAVLKKHWPEWIGQWDDVHTFPPSPASDWAVDVICGGDPCQENSKARAPKGVVRHKSLGDEFLRIIAAIRPRIVVRENPSAVRKDAPWPWWRMRSGLESLGYSVLPFRLRACCLGAKHQRDRLFLLAELADANCNRLERWPRKSQEGQTTQLSRFLDGHDWPQIPTARGYRSRAGIPNYVGELNGYGNSVSPIVAEWIGRRIIESAA